MVARSVGMTEDGLLESLREDMLRREMLRGADRAGARARRCWPGSSGCATTRSAAGGPWSCSADAIAVARARRRRRSRPISRTTKDKWQTPEYRRITVVELRPADFAGEAAGRARRRSAPSTTRGIAEFRMPEQREVTQLLAPDEATAKAAVELVAGRQDADEVARRAGRQRCHRRGAGGDDAASSCRPSWRRPSSRCGPGQVSPPVQSLFGWHVFRLDGSCRQRPCRSSGKRPELRAASCGCDAAAERLPELGNRWRTPSPVAKSLEAAAAAGRCHGAPGRGDGPPGSRPRRQGLPRRPADRPR